MISSCSTSPSDDRTAAPARRVHLRQHVVQKEDRRLTPVPAEDLRLREAKGQRDRPLLRPGGVSRGRRAVELQANIVAVRPLERHPGRDVAAETARQRLAECGSELLTR